MTNTKKYKRKNYFIKKGFQGRYMLNFYLLLTLLLLVFTILLSYNTAQHLTITYENYNLQIASTPAALFKYILTASWFTMIPLGLLLAWVVMRYTHRIAGPLYKFETILDQMSRGILDTQINLRKNDDGQEVIAKIREVNCFLSDKVIKISDLTEKLNDNPTISNSPELQELVASLQKSLAEFEIKK